MTLNIQSEISRADDLIASQMEDEIVMMSITNGKYYGMNNVGSAIWNLLEQPSKVSDICSKLVEEYEIDEPTCEKEVLAYLEQLLDQQLIVVK